MLYKEEILIRNAFTLVTIVSVFLTSCSDELANDSQKHRLSNVNHPVIFEPQSYGIIIGKTTKQNIYNDFNVLARDRNIILINPKDAHFRALESENIIVYLDDNDVVSGISVTYKPRKLLFKALD